MTDIVERLRTFEEYVDRVAIAHEAADEIERLRAELEVQSYWGPRWEKEHAEVERLRADFAESQAREEKLREALTQCEDTISHFSYLWAGAGVHPQTAIDAAQGALALPHDDSALKERLRQDRERVCEFIRNNYQDHNIASLLDAIRAMGDE